MTWPEVGDLPGRPVLAIPVGATEQHGPHLPLDTDTAIAVALTREVARRRRDLVIAPALPFGSSGEHQAFPGTLSIGQDATRLVLIELVRSANLTFPRVLLVVGHGGNAEPVRAAVEVLRGEGCDVAAWAPSFGGDAHAGHVETSLSLHLRPDQVRTQRAAAGTVTPLADLLPLLRVGGVRAVSANGVLGDPTGAQAQHGATLWEAAVARLDAFISAWLHPSPDQDS
ncbi:MAG TPA: mycofactocin biosynthesis peptidyl-dipeptidase MftE [Kineosporiaceae bacterium]